MLNLENYSNVLIGKWKMLKKNGKQLQLGELCAKLFELRQWEWENISKQNREKEGKNNLIET